MAIIISVVNNKGGVAKTSTVSSLGYAWARTGKKVLLVDLDSQANLTTITSTIPIDEHERLILDALIDKEQPPIDKVEDNLDVIPSGLGLANFERELASDNLRVYALSDVLAHVKDQYDYIILDCPPALSTITYNALVASDFFIMVSTPDSMSYSGIKMIVTLAGDIRTNPRLNPNLKLLGCLVTRANERAKVDNLYIRRIKEEMTERHFIPIVIPMEEAMKQAVACGMNIFDYKADSKCAQAYQELAEYLERKIQNKLNETKEVDNE